MAISRREKNRQVLAELDEPAERLPGLKPGTGVADARAMHPGLEIAEEEPQADRRLLESLADWCDRYTPLVALDGADGLFLDIAGCAHLFGGEALLLEDALARLSRQGFRARAGLASTPGAAWAVARFGPRAAEPIPPGGEAEALAPMPLKALRIGTATRNALESVGLRAVGMLFAVPRAPLARRFGPELLERLDQALGRAQEAIGPRLVPAPLSAERHLAEPVAAAEMVEDLAGKLAETLEADLERRGEGARLLELALFRVDGAVFRVPLRLSRPLRDPRLVRRILRERLGALEGRIDAGFGFDLLRLSVLATGRVAAGQADWLEESRPGEEAFGVFADRLRARFGAALFQAVPAASHVPERAVLLKPFDAADEEGPAAPEGGPAPRPLRLFAPPEPVDVSAEVPDGPPFQFRWRRVLHRVARSEGPERIAPEWWRDEAGPIALECEAPKGDGGEEDGGQGSEKPATRDYFRIEDSEGRRFWLFRQGLYGSGPAPGLRWFLHGIFA